MVDVFILVAVAIIILGGMADHDCSDAPDWRGSLSDDVLVVPLALRDAFWWVLIRRIALFG